MLLFCVFYSCLRYVVAFRIMADSLWMAEKHSSTVGATGRGDCSCHYGEGKLVLSKGWMLNLRPLQDFAPTGWRRNVYVLCSLGGWQARS